MTTEVFTICARNYLAFAITLGESLLKQQPDTRFTVWLIDQGELPAAPAEIRLRPVKDDAVPGGEFEDLCLRYNILELATAIKPACMKRHFADGAGQVLYMDPDIYVFRPLEAVMDALEAGAQGMLIPHILQPLPQDDTHPDDLDILRSGIYNLGFLALAAGTETDALLDWWWSWLRTHAFSDPKSGVFTDQKWMNFALLFWPRLQVLRHPGYNVAYWNLPQRRLSRVGDDWQVDGDPLVFFHFSGFDPSNPKLLSKHQNRILIKPWSDLAKLLNFYAAEVLNRGHAQFQQLPLPQLRFANGILFDRVCQRLYQEAREQGKRFAHPLAIGPGTFIAWINESLVQGVPADVPHITRYLKGLYELRPDVQRAYPDLLGEDRLAFLTWVQRSAVREMAIDSYFLSQAGTTDITPHPEPPGVNFVGYLRAEMGVGEAARGYIRALRAQDVPLSLIDVSSLSEHRQQDQSLGDIPLQDDPAPYALNIVHVNADLLPIIRDYISPDFFQNRYNIGIWAWESPTFPHSWYDRFVLLDEIWVGSSFMADAIGRVAPIPVIQMPHIVEVPDCPPDRAAFGLSEDEFIFLFMFDCNSFLQRKNPEAAVDAFCRAFEPHQPVRLLIKSMHGDKHSEAYQALQKRTGDARISFVDGVLDSEARYQLIVSCDAFLSLHRAEGFGLSIAEAMALGKPVLATGWSGNMDFINVANSLPVAYSLKTLDQDEGPYEKGTLWAEPDIEHAAQLMRQLVNDPSLGQRLGMRARLDIQQYFSAAAVGERLLERLRLISQRREPSRRLSEQWNNRPLVRWRGRLWLSGSRVWRSILRHLPTRIQPAASRTMGKLAKHLRLLPR